MDNAPSAPAAFLPCPSRPVPAVCRALLPALALLLLLVASVAAEPARLFRIGTGGQTGVYYPIGKQIAQGLTGAADGAAMTADGESGVPGLLAVAQNSAGSVANAQAVAAGEIEAGMVQADVAFRALQGQGEFAAIPAARSLRAIASLYPEKLQLVTRSDARIGSVADLRGRRFSVDEVGSGTLAVMRLVLEAHGLAEADLSPVYLKPVFTAEKMTSGELQGFAMMAGTPMEAVTRLAGLGLSMVPIDPTAAARINDRYPFLVPGLIPADAYAGIGETPTLAVHALLVVSEALDEATAYQLTRSLWSRRTKELLEAGHPQGKAIRQETALTGLSLPLHSGAERYYRELGLRP